jgi:hypothetical protein
MIVKNGKLCKISTGTNAKTYAYTRTQTSGTTASQGSLEIETTVTQNSGNLITSGAVYNFSQPSRLYETDESINCSGLVKLVNNKVCKLSSTANNTQVFESATSNYISICSLNTDKYIVVYADAGNSNYLTACVLTVSGATVSAGTPAVISANANTKNCVVKLDTDKALLTYKIGSSSIYSVVLTVSGTTITVNTPALISSSRNASFIKCIQLTNDQALLLYNDASVYMRTLSISSTTITINNEVTIIKPYGMTNSINDIAVCQMTRFSFGIAVSDSSLSEFYVSAGSVSGNTPSLNYLYYSSIFTRGNIQSLVTIDENSYFALASYDGLTGAVVNITGTNVTSGCPVANSYFTIKEYSSDLSISKLSNNRFLLNYVNSENKGSSRVLTWDGHNVLVGDPIVFNNQTTDYIASDTTSYDYSIVVYKDSDGYGTARTITVDRADGYALTNSINKQNITGISTDVNIIPYVSLT